MIHAAYRWNGASKTFTIKLANTPVVQLNYRPVNSTYHLENAIRRAAKGRPAGSPPSSVKDALHVYPSKYVICISDQENQYLTILASQVQQFIRSTTGKAVEIA